MSIKNDIKNTFSHFLDTVKSDNKEKIYKRNEEKNVNKTKEEAYNRVLQETEKKATQTSEMKQQNSSGKTANSNSQKNKPARAITINDSPTVNVMEPKEKNDVYLVIDELKNRKTVMIKLGSVDDNTRKEILSNIYGACYFANYVIEKIDSQMILIDPNFRSRT